MRIQKPCGPRIAPARGRRWAWPAVIGLLATGWLAACASPSGLEGRTVDPNTVVIGTAGPMSGPYAMFGEQQELGAAQAVSDLNAAGGILGKQIVLEVGDDGCDPRRAVSVANQMVRNGAVFMAGHFCSGSSIPAGAVYAEEGILQISPASTNPALTEDGDHTTFRVVGRDDWQGDVIAEFLTENYPDARVGIIHDRTAYGKGLADVVRESLAATGVTVARYQAIATGRSDYSGLVAELKSAGIDALFVGGYHTETGLIARQMRDAGMNIQVLGPDSLVTDEYWAIAGDAGEGTLMTFLPDPRDFPEARQVVASFRDRGMEPEGFTLHTYAAVQVWAQAAEAAGTFDPDMVAAAMRSMPFDTVLGTLTFDDKGDIEQRAFVLYRWSRGTYRQFTSR